jgi:hypothetical protein
LAHRLEELIRQGASHTDQPWGQADLAGIVFRAD